MIKIAIWGNCQAGALAAVLRNQLNDARYSITAFSNNPRTDPNFSEESVLSSLGSHDIIIYQPLATHHGRLSDDAVREAFSSKILLRFAYQFNDGIQSLGYAPMTNATSYGTVYGEDVVIDLLRKHPVDDIVRQYADGRIDFSLKQRFRKCLEELAAREDICDLQTADYIAENHRTVQLFVTHNHPTRPVFDHLGRQVLRRLSERWDESRTVDFVLLPYTGAPISLHDARIMKYEFGYHSDWLCKGTELITMLFRHHILHQEQPVWTAKRKVVLADTTDNL